MTYIYAIAITCLISYVVLWYVARRGVEKEFHVKKGILQQWAMKMFKKNPLSNLGRHVPKAKRWGRGNIEVELLGYSWGRNKMTHVVEKTLSIIREHPDLFKIEEVRYSPQRDHSNLEKPLPSQVYAEIIEKGSTNALIEYVSLRFYEKGCKIDLGPSKNSPLQKIVSIDPVIDSIEATTVHIIPRVNCGPETFKCGPDVDEEHVDVLRKEIELYIQENGFDNEDELSENIVLPIEETEQIESDETNLDITIEESIAEKYETIPVEDL
jgi:hypothetical protein